jgi:hypothetical protein
MEFHFDNGVGVLESLGALFPDSAHLSLWVDMQDLNIVAVEPTTEAIRNSR